MSGVGIGVPAGSVTTGAGVAAAGAAAVGAVFELEAAVGAVVGAALGAAVPPHAAKTTPSRAISEISFSLILLLAQTI